MGPKGSLGLGLKGQDYILDTESSERTSEAGPVCWDGLEAVKTSGLEGVWRVRVLP